MPRYALARFAFTQSLIAAALILFGALSASAQHPGTAQYTTILNFENYDQGNSGPNSLLVADASGNLYGTTGLAPNDTGGGVFELTPAGDGTWNESFFAMDVFANGEFPNGVILDSKTGNLYGTTSSGGTGKCGVVFEVTPPSAGSGSWSENVLYNFTCETDGDEPDSPLIEDSQGRLYGTTFFGGKGVGVVFMLTPPSAAGGSWAEQVLYSFLGGGNGGYPGAGLVMDGSGAIYGTTDVEGIPQDLDGTAFKLTPRKSGPWAMTILHAFHGSRGNYSDGGRPVGSLVLDGSGAVYGATSAGGDGCPVQVHLGCGTIYQLVPPTSQGGTWTENILYNFGSAGKADGLGPSGVVFDSTGALWGTTYGGGTNSNGTVFKLTPPSGGVGSWTPSAISLPRGSYGSAGILLMGSDIYGTTPFGGTNGGGTVFELVP